VTFDVLYVFVVLSLERRRILHVNVTAHPFADWAARQVAEAIGFTDTFGLLIRDRDGIYGAAFDRSVEARGIKQLRIAPRSPWQNGHVERLVGTLRREAVDHIVVLGQRHLLRFLRDYVRYYNDDRPHLSFGGDTPAGRMLELPENGTVVSFPRVGGLHHRYARRAA
jgi:transposase InsO family protein